jgi:hypothetical protein
MRSSRMRGGNARHSSRPSTKRPTCLAQRATVIAVGLSVGDKVFAGKGLGQIRHFVPHRLGFFKIRTLFNVTFRTGTEALCPTAAASFAGAAGVKQLIVGFETTATRIVFDLLVQPVNPAPGSHGAFLVLHPLTSPWYAGQSEHRTPHADIILVISSSILPSTNLRSSSGWCDRWGLDLFLFLYSMEREGSPDTTEENRRKDHQQNQVVSTFSMR